MSGWTAWTWRQHLQLFVDVSLICSAVGIGAGWVIVIVKTALWIAP